MINIVLYAHNGSKNHGCEAIVRSTIKILKCIPTVYSYRKNEDLQYIIDKSVNFKSTNEIKMYSFRHILYRILSQFAGNRNHYTRYIYKPMFVNTIINAIYMSIGGDNYCYDSFPNQLSYINKELNKKNYKTVLWGCSIEPNLLKQADIVEDMELYSLIIARESITYNALIGSGVTKNIKLYPDPAFTLEAVKLEPQQGFIENKTIGINVSPLVQHLEQRKNITYSNYYKLIQYIIEQTDNNVALIPHVVWKKSNDLVPLTQLYNEFKGTGRVILIGDHNCMELKGLISHCRMFIGSRTHATIAAYSTCVPTLVMGYSVKAKGIAKDIFGTYENYVISVQSLQNKDDLTKAFQWLCDHENEIRTHLQNFMPSYIEKAWLAGDEVRKLMGE